MSDPGDQARNPEDGTGRGPQAALDALCVYARQRRLPGPVTVAASAPRTPAVRLEVVAVQGRSARFRLEDGSVIGTALHPSAVDLLQVGDDVWAFEPRQGGRLQAVRWNSQAETYFPLSTLGGVRAFTEEEAAQADEGPPRPQEESLTVEQARRIWLGRLAQMRGGRWRSWGDAATVAVAVGFSAWCAWEVTKGAVPLLAGCVLGVVTIWRLVKLRRLDRARLQGVDADADLEQVSVVAGAPYPRICVVCQDGRRLEWDVLAGLNTPAVGTTVWASNPREGSRVALVRMVNSRGFVTWSGSAAVASAEDVADER